MDSRAFLGAGDLFINRYDMATGLKLGIAGPFQCSKFEIKPNSDIKEQVSKGRETYGQTIATVAIPKPADITIVLTEMDKDGLTMALLGTASDFNQGAGTITDEPIVAKLDKWVRLSKENFATAAFAVEHSTGAPVYVLGTDYLVNYRLGMVKALSSGAITEAQTLHVSGAYSAITGTKISGATQAQVKGEFILDGKNFVDGLPVICTAHEVVLTPESPFDFLANDFGEINLKGRANTPAGKSEPFVVELRNAV